MLIKSLIKIRLNEAERDERPNVQSCTQKDRIDLRQSGFPRNKNECEWDFKVVVSSLGDDNHSYASVLR